MGQQLEVEHQCDVLGERRRNTFGLNHLRHVEAVLLLGGLYTSLDIAHPLKILVNLEAIGLSHFASQIGYFVGHGVKNRPVSLHPRQTNHRIGTAGVAKHLFEHHARVVLHRQRRRLAPPANRVRVDTTMPAATLAGVRPTVDRQLQ